MVRTEKTSAPRLDTLPDLLTLKQVKELLDVASDRTMRSLIADGRFPGPIRLNARLHRWSRAVVAAWFASNGELTTEPRDDGHGGWQFMAGG